MREVAVASRRYKDELFSAVLELLLSSPPSILPRKACSTSRPVSPSYQRCLFLHVDVHEERDDLSLTLRITFACQERHFCCLNVTRREHRVCWRSKALVLCCGRRCWCPCKLLFRWACRTHSLLPQPCKPLSSSAAAHRTRWRSWPPQLSPCWNPTSCPLTTGKLLHRQTVVPMPRAVMAFSHTSCMADYACTCHEKGAFRDMSYTFCFLTSEGNCHCPQFCHPARLCWQIAVADWSGMLPR